MRKADVTGVDLRSGPDDLGTWDPALTFSFSLMHQELHGVAGLPGGLCAWLPVELHTLGAYPPLLK